MKKIGKLILLSTIILTNTFGIVTNVLGKTKEEIEIDGTKYDISYDISQGYIQGLDDGGIDGYNQGHLSYKNKLNYKYTTYIDKDYNRSLTQAYLEDMTKSYLNGYEKGYYVGYEYGFLLGITNLTYTSINNFEEVVSEVDDDKTKGSAAGEAAGKNAGEFYGRLDYIGGKNISDYSLSLQKYKDQEALSSRYDFHRMYYGYGEEFTKAFEVAFANAYIDSFFGLATGLTVQDYLYDQVKNEGYEWSLERDIGEGMDKVLTLQFNEGTVLGEGFIGGNLTRAKIYFDESRYTYVTPGFSIRAFNLNNQTRSEYVKLYKPIKLKIPFYGSDSVGIYEMRNGVWNYLYTDIYEGEISHTISPKDYYGGVYTVFVEDKYHKFDDIGFSFANKEIYTFARRNHILAWSNQFNPTGEITRREFVYLINKIKNPNNLSMEIDKEFVDVDEEDVATNAINFMVSNGYMNGTGEDTFSPQSPITYNQVDIVLNRVTNGKFNWSDVEQSMKIDKFYLSKGTNDKNKNITREELVYTLYYLFG